MRRERTLCNAKKYVLTLIHTSAILSRVCILNTCMSSARSALKGNGDAEKGGSTGAREQGQ